MKWDEFNKQQVDVPLGLVQTDIECPNCGKNLCMRTDEVLTTHPILHIYTCEYCGWIGRSHAVYRPHN